MIKLLKHLKPFSFGLALTIALLFGQALCDLNLPNYMSRIVNIGIQQSGIEHAAPDAISPSGMKLMKTFMTESERKIVDENYEPVPGTNVNADGKAYISIYPKAGDRLYVKRKIKDDAVNVGLDNVFELATMTLMNVMRDMAAQSDKPDMIDKADDKIDIKMLYDMQTVFDSLPESAVKSYREKAVQTDRTILMQSGIMLARMFYEELGADISGMQAAYIIRVGAIMLVIALLGGTATILVSLLSSGIAAGFGRNVRKEMFKKIESFSKNEIDKFSTASLITRCTNDITQIQTLLMVGIRMVFYAPIIGTGGVIMAVRKSVSMSWIIAAACIVLTGMIMIVTAIAMPRFEAIQQLTDRLNLVSRENLSGMMVIRAFGRQEHEKNRFERANENLTKTNLFINRVFVFMMPAISFVMNGAILLIVWVGARQIAGSAMQVGDMMAFIQYTMQIILSFLSIAMIFIFLPRAEVSAKRIAEVMEAGCSIVDPPNPREFDESKKGYVEFRHVYFRYHGAEEYALRDITFTAKPGQTTAIIGSTGSGKSTIANLILRFYDVTEGQVLVDGVDIREVRQKDLRERIGYVPQKSALFSGTIASNLRYGRKDASDDEIEAAARVAQAMEFISEKPERFNSPIAQGGTNVSGGQKQRLSIARALVKKPEIYVFDDSFSALDFKTDAALRKALKEYTRDSTVIIAAQRVGTIMNADQIIVLDEGRIVGCGTHKELLKNCPQYYEIAASQLSEEELA